MTAAAPPLFVLGVPLGGTGGGTLGLSTPGAEGRPTRTEGYEAGGDVRGAVGVIAVRGANVGEQTLAGAESVGDTESERESMKEELMYSIR